MWKAHVIFAYSLQLLLQRWLMGQAAPRALPAPLPTEVLEGRGYGDRGTRAKSVRNHCRITNKEVLLWRELY